MIPITKPFLPPLKEYETLLAGIWQRNWLTNNGPLAIELENKLKNYLEVEDLLFTTNGTISLQIAIKALELKGEIITTPFTYIATTSSIVWEGCIPVFVDIDKQSFNIDPNRIEEAITDKTSAIIATHVYGNPCDVFEIQRIADKYDIKVIYDGAHAFGVRIAGQSIFNFGDISTCSLHATKLFHSGEGGLVITKDKELRNKMAYIRNFGHDGPEKFYCLGINGKNSEIHAALGLLNLNYILEILNQRKFLSNYYDKKLKRLKLTKPKWYNHSTTNYSYYPVLFENESKLLKCINDLESNKIFGRRYFYPSLAQSLDYLKKKRLKNTEQIAKRVFCLPLYHELKPEEIDLVCDVIIKSQEA